jgi:hypothetical protein
MILFMLCLNGNGPRVHSLESNEVSSPRSPSQAIRPWPAPPRAVPRPNGFGCEAIPSAFVRDSQVSCRLASTSLLCGDCREFGSVLLDISCGVLWKSATAKMVQHFPGSALRRQAVAKADALRWDCHSHTTSPILANRNHDITAVSMDKMATPEFETKHRPPSL